MHRPKRRFLQGPDTDRTVVEKVGRAVANGENVSVDLLNYRKDGSTFWNALYLSPVRGAGGDIQFFFASQLDVSDRVAARQQLIDQKEIVDREVGRRTADLQASLQAQTLLLHEVDHRVKNNLSVIGSLIRLQIRDTEDANVRKALRTTMERVDALAAVHRRLYQTDDVRYFDVSSFVLNLVQDAISGGDSRHVFLQSNMQSVDLPSDQATSVGLLLNEILLQVLALPSPVHTINLSCLDQDDAIVITMGSRTLLPFDHVDIPVISQTLMARLSSPVGASIAWNSSSLHYTATLTIPRKE